MDRHIWRMAYSAENVASLVRWSAILGDTRGAALVELLYCDIIMNVKPTKCVVAGCEAYCAIGTAKIQERINGGRACYYV